MKKLELLGVQPGEDNLMLNDAEGNRYLLPMTDALRAALRKDRTPHTSARDPQTPMSPREIQALLREGRTVEDISEITSIPASRISALARPIEAERNYTALTARQYTMGRDIGGFSLEELVTSRLVGRGVDVTTLEWDATRKADNPWMLRLTFTSASREHVALWAINLDKKSVTAHNDEASWLSETSLSTDAGPWRPANTPPAPQVADSPQQDSPDIRQESVVDEVLASLDSQRGKNRPMPDADIDVDPDDFDGAHFAPEEVQDSGDKKGPATIVALPSRMEQLSGQAALLEPENVDNSSSKKAGTKGGSAISGVSAVRPLTSEDNETSSPRHGRKGKKAEAESSGDTSKSSSKKKKNSRPSMPAWDEIIFGKKDD
ncbi:septation protein SepH [Actinotignum urinale]|uniref:septation protein SepH n=1 Tax=Actinotignum urinale TaxID=190146 RepID=UPI0003B570E8|nr:septation protein SepH [Actinotignum urinale]MDY5160896.1 septation protein SepH [Actinotignum urinale]